MKFLILMMVLALACKKTEVVPPPAEVPVVVAETPAESVVEPTPGTAIDPTVTPETPVEPKVEAVVK